MLVLTVAMACAPQQHAQVAEPTLAARQQSLYPFEGPRTAEEAIRQQDLHRLWALDEYDAAQQLDMDMTAFDAEGMPADAAAEGTMSRWEHIGRATWSVMTVMFTLGMAALPFLV